MTIPNTSLQSLVDRIERLKQNLKEIFIEAQNLKEIFAEEKETGFDVKVLKKIIKLRSDDPIEAVELVAILETYAASVGQPELPRLFV